MRKSQAQKLKTSKERGEEEQDHGGHGVQRELPTSNSHHEIPTVSGKTLKTSLKPGRSEFWLQKNKKK